MYDNAGQFWYVGTPSGYRLRVGRRRAFVVRFKTFRSAQARADKLNADDAKFYGKESN